MGNQLGDGGLAAAGRADEQDVVEGIVAETTASLVKKKKTKEEVAAEITVGRGGVIKMQLTLGPVKIDLEASIPETVAAVTQLTIAFRENDIIQK